MDPPPLAKPFVNVARKLIRNRGGLIGQLKQKFRKHEKREAMTPEFRAELCEFFVPEVKKLSQLLGRDLSHWVEDETSGNPTPIVPFPTTNVPVQQVTN